MLQVLKKKTWPRFNKWLNKPTRNALIRIEVDSPEFAEGRDSPKAYFTITIGKDKYPFAIGRQGEVFSDQFLADLSENCSNKRQCAWNAEMENFLAETEDFSVQTVLDKAIEIALNLDDFASNPYIIVPKKPKQKSDLEELFAFFASVNNLLGVLEVALAEPLSHLAP